MNKLNEKLKNAVRRITEPCDRCGGLGKSKFTERKNESYQKMYGEGIHFDPTCKTCKGKGWCPKLEFGCEVRVIGEDESGYEESYNGVDEVGVVNQVGYIQFLYADNCCVIDDIYIKEYKEGYDEDREVSFETLGKPIETREVLLALRDKGHYFIDVWGEIGFIDEDGEWQVIGIKIPLDKQPKDYPEELVGKLIELLK